ncbi:MAG: two-component regulator propeller domain-containing protein [Terracidiphilus sp.]|jgi:signal transduction histidine kinase/ligand-binding sensor domain-containing protein
MSQRKLLLIFFALVAAAQPLLAFNPASGKKPFSAETADTIRIPVIEGSDLMFREMHNAGNISQSRVLQIVQDNQGFMWFGTQYGLDRFDGSNFRVFVPEPDQPNSLGGAYVYSLFNDRSGMLWVGCNQSLDRLDPTRDLFTHFRILSDGDSGTPVTVVNISQDHLGELWLATGYGLYAFNPDTGKVARHYTHDPGDASSLNSNDLRLAGEDRNGRFWVLENDALEELDRDSGKVKLRVPLPDSLNYSAEFFEDHLGIFWVVYDGRKGGGGIAFLNRDSGKLTYMSMFDRSTSHAVKVGAGRVMEDENGDLWFATQGNGLLKLDRKRQLMISYRHHQQEMGSIAEDRVISTGKDGQGNLWIGFHARAPNFFSPRRPLFTSPVPLDLNVNESGESIANAISEDKEGNVWVGITGSLIRIDAESRAVKVYKPNAAETRFYPIAIAEDPDRYIWVGTAGQGLYRFDPRKGEFRNYRHIASDPFSISSDLIHQMFLDQSRTMWLTTENGLDRFDSGEGRFTSYKLDPRNSTEYYYGIAEDSEGKLWLGGTSGVQSFDPRTDEFRSFQHKPGDPASLSDNLVRSVHFDQSGTLWAATENGLDKFDAKSGQFTTYYTTNGLPSNSTNCILGDRRGNLWISTTLGISEFDPKAETFRNFTVADGLPGMDFTGYLACFEGADGKMFFGGFSGATEFDPAQFAERKDVPPVVFTDFRLFGKSVKAGDGSPLSRSINYTGAITLSHTQNTFSLDFAALDYSNPLNHRFRYMLEGLDSQWSETSADQTFVGYSSVPPGNYALRIQIGNSQGGWSPTNAVMHIEVLTPWWGTWWFKLTCLSCFLFATFSLLSYRTRQMVHQAEVRLQERLEERTRIARELHDTLLQSLHGLMFQFQAARNMLPRRPEDARQTLDEAISETEHAIAESRDAIQDLRSRPVSERELAPLLETAGEELAAVRDTNQNSPSFRVIVEGDPQKLSPDLQDEVYRIAHEVLRNAFRHAGASQIEVEIRYDKNQLRLRIRDDGKGIDPKVLEERGRPGHWGLPGVRERAQQIGSQLSFWSQAGAGTEVELSIPAAIAYEGRPNGHRFRVFRKERKS